MSKKFFALMLLSMTILFGGCSDSADVKDNSKTANNTNAAQVSTISLNIGDKIGHIGQSGMEGYTQLDGDLMKGIARFGDKLYFHFDKLLLREKMPNAKTQDEQQQIFDEAGRFGGSDIANTVPVFVFEGGTTICPVTDNGGYEFYLLKTETGAGGCSTLIGEQDGKWVKYFEEMYLTTSKKLGGNYYFKRVYADSDAIIFDYEQSDTKKICNVIYRWNEATKSFDSEVVQ